MFALLNSPEFVFLLPGGPQDRRHCLPGELPPGGGEIAQVIDDSRPRVFVYDAQFGALSGQALELCSHRPEIVLVAGKAEAPLPAGHTAYGDYAAGRPETDPPIDFDPHIYDETTRLYTSGTTGRPKGGAHQQHQRGPLGPRRDDCISRWARTTAP